MHLWPNGRKRLMAAMNPGNYIISDNYPFGGNMKKNPTAPPRHVVDAERIAKAIGLARVASLAEIGRQLGENLDWAAIVQACQDVGKPSLLPADPPPAPSVPRR